MPYQWQKKSGSFFTNLSNSSIYSGVFNDTLTISNTNLGLNNAVFRCIVAPGSSCADTSNNTNLYVINNVGINDYNLLINFYIYPNPVTDKSTIFFSLIKAQKLKFKVLDIRGQVVQTFENTNFNGGENSMEWKSTELNSGIYFLSIKGENFTETKKVIVLN